MKVILALLALVGLALLGSRWTFMARRLPLGIRVFFTGSELIVAGLLLGSEFLNLMDEETLSVLSPFVCVALGWIGFLFGLQLDRWAFQRLPRGIVEAAAMEAGVTFAAVLPVAWLLFGGTSETASRNVALAAATVAAAAACTGQTTLALLHPRERRASRRVLSLLRQVAGLDAAVGLVAFGVALAFLGNRLGAGSQVPGTARWLALSVALALLTAWIFVSLTSGRTSQAELVLYLLGTLALSSGIALAFRLSPLFVGFVCGLLVAARPPAGAIRGRLLELLVKGEKFLYSALLVLVGAWWEVPSLAVSVLALAYVATRWGGKVAGGWLASRRLRERPPASPGFGLGLISQAGMALAIAVDYRLAATGFFVPEAVSIVILAVLVNEFLAPGLATWVLKRADALEARR